MISVQRRERIRRAYYVEGKSMRQIASELRHSYWTVRDALGSAEAKRYTLQGPKPAPKLGPYQGRIDELLLASEQMPPKQRYTGRKLYELLKGEGYQGSASNLRRYIGERRRELKRPQVYLPLSFAPGVDAQVDWGEATVRLPCQPDLLPITNGQPTTPPCPPAASPSKKATVYRQAQCVKVDYS